MLKRLGEFMEEQKQGQGQSITNGQSKEVSISIVCPCYNEQVVLARFHAQISQILTDIQLSYELLFINDGSSDDTLSVLNQLAKNDPNIRIINLSRNFGKEAALTAGLNLAKGDAIIPIDADLQDPPELIRDFIQEWQKGFDVVVAKRVDRSSDTISKRITANLFYRFHNSIAHPEIPDNVGDFRLISRRVVTAIQLLPENQRFMKGIFSWVGFKTSVIEYTRQPRAAGETSFNGWRLWNFALEGITSFSTAHYEYGCISALSCPLSPLSMAVHHHSYNVAWHRFTRLCITFKRGSIHWRYSAYWAWGDGRVHWKDLYGDKGTSCLHC
nr:glycosyltransferase family 2 protein [Enterovibrio nigricans]